MHKLSIEGAYLLDHQVHADSRGSFREWYKKSIFQSLAITFEISQANYSFSNQGVLRGLHYSTSPVGQAKLVTCAFGQVLDVIVDLRLGSPTYLEVEKIPLDYDSGNTLFVPSGVGHSFLVLSESAAVAYLTSSEFDSEFEKTISPFDPKLGIDWPVLNGVPYALSDRDLQAPMLDEMKIAGHLPKFSS